MIDGYVLVNTEGNPRGVAGEAAAAHLLTLPGVADARFESADWDLREDALVYFVADGADTDAVIETIEIASWGAPEFGDLTVAACEYRGPDPTP